MIMSNKLKVLETEENEDTGMSTVVQKHAVVATKFTHCDEREKQNTQ